MKKYSVARNKSEIGNRVEPSPQDNLAEGSDRGSQPSIFVRTGEVLEAKVTWLARQPNGEKWDCP